jgi:hypothetical protein
MELEEITEFLNQQIEFNWKIKELIEQLNQKLEEL